MPDSGLDVSLLPALLFRVPDVFESLKFFSSVVDDDDSSELFEELMPLLPGVFRRRQISRAIIALKMVNASSIGRNTNMNMML